MIFDRKLYLDKLIKSKNKNFIKIITGIRRCGKSFLLNKIFADYLKNHGVDKNHIIKIDFDSPKNKKYTKALPLFEYLESLIKDKKTYYFLLDEIQLVEEFESVLNGLLRKENVDVYVTGSNSKFLSSDVITEFRGRGYEIRVYPLSFSEFYPSFKGEKFDALNEYMLYGGMPAVTELETVEEKSNYLKNLFDTVYIKDVTERYKLNNIEEFNELINTISSSIGSLTNPTKLENTFKSQKGISLSKITIQHYLDYLKDCFLIDSALRYDIKGRRYINTPLKYYFTDPGLRNARIGFRQYEQTHLMENIIFNELKIRGYNVDVGIVEVNTKNEKGNNQKKQFEVDFVCNQGSKRYYIQSAFAIPDEEKMKQETNALVNIEDSFKKIVIVKDSSPIWHNEDGILIMNIKDFLLNPTSLDL